MNPDYKLHLPEDNNIFETTDDLLNVWDDPYDGINHADLMWEEEEQRLREQDHDQE